MPGQGAPAPEAVLRGQSALARFALSGADFSLIRHNENAVYDVRADGRRYVLRIHAPAPGFEPLPLCDADSLRQRKAEMELLRFLKEGGLRAQTPVPGLDGDAVQRLDDGTPATLLEWAAGDSYDALWGDANLPESAAYAAGFAAGRLNALARGTTQNFARFRPRYGKGVLPIVDERLRAAHDAEVVNREQLAVMRAALGRMGPLMRGTEAETGLSLCHADISAGNLVWDGDAATLIDFSLAGIASPYLDLASLLTNFTRGRVRDGLCAGWEDGYGKRALLRLAEPYCALVIMLFLSQRYPAAKEWDWFPDALDGWTRDVFLPLARGETFIEGFVPKRAPFTPALKIP